MIKKILATAILAAIVQMEAAFPGMGDSNKTSGETAGATAQAEANAVDNDALETIRKNAQGRLGIAVKKVEQSPIAGLFEVVIDNEVVYMDKNAEYIVMGEMFHTLSRKNLTEEAKNRLLQINFDDLPLNDAIKTVNGNGSRKIAVFSDPNCSFCKKLEATLKDAKDITIYTFLYPVITPTSREASANIWCSSDRSAAWKAHMLDGKSPSKADAKCDTSVLDRNIELGQKLNVTGTPVIFTPSGHRTPGAVGIEYLEKMLAEPQSK